MKNCQPEYLLETKQFVSLVFQKKMNLESLPRLFFLKKTVHIHEKVWDFFFTVEGNERREKKYLRWLCLHILEHQVNSGRIFLCYR